jgi:hypothetical protein
LLPGQPDPTDDNRPCWDSLQGRTPRGRLSLQVVNCSIPWRHYVPRVDTRLLDQLSLLTTMILTILANASRHRL